MYINRVVNNAQFNGDFLIERMFIDLMIFEAWSFNQISSDSLNMLIGQSSNHA